MKRLFLVLLALCGSVWGVACPTGYTKTVKITVPAVASLSANLSNYPLLVQGNYVVASTTYGGFSQSSGLDVVFCDAATSGNLLSYELAPGTYSASAGAGEWWVSLPTLSKTTAQFVYAMVGKASDTDHSCGPSGSNNCSSTLWTNALVVVHGGNTSALDTTDSTGRNTITNTGVIAGYGKMAGDLNFGASGTNYLTTNTTNSASVYSVEAWTLPNATGSVLAIAGNMNSSTNAGIFTYAFSSGATFCLNSAGAQSCARYTSAGAFNSWHHMVNEYNGGNGTLTSSYVMYLDGVAQTTTMSATSVSALVAPTVNLQIGSSGGSNLGFHSDMDEVRVWSTVLSADFVTADYQFQSGTASATWDVVPLASCPTGYGYFQKITWASSTWGLSGNVTAFQLPIAGGSPAATVANGGYSQSTGLDIVVCDAQTGGNLLPYERANYSATTGAVELWVRTPITSGTDTSVYVFIGKAGDTGHACNDTSYAACGNLVWRNFLGVYHGGSSSSLVLTDSTGSSNATTANVTATTGKVNGAFQMVNAGAASTLALNSNEYASTVTYELWLNHANNNTASYFPCANFSLGTGNNGYALLSSDTGTTTSKFGFFDQTFNANTTQVFSTNTFSQSAWHHVVSAYNGGLPTASGSYFVYVDGASQATTSGALIGGWPVPQTTMSCSGVLASSMIDELRFYAGVYSGDTAIASYKAQSSLQSVSSVTPTASSAQPWVIVVN